MVYKNQEQENYITYGQMNLINDFRALWAELAIWERSYIASIAAGFGNDAAISERLYRIPSEFKSKLETFYGETAPERFEFLLSKHITLIQEMAKAQQRGDTDAVNENVVKLYNNADEISTHLAMINPYWNAAQWRVLLDQYLRLTIDQTVALFSGDFSRDIDIYDRLAHYSLILGDYMAAGVMQYLITKEARKNKAHRNEIQSQEHRPNHITYGHMNMIHDFKRLWIELTIWQRTLIASMASSFGDKAIINQRLHRVTSDFKKKLQMFYGKVLPEHLEFLLLKHLVIAEGVVTALKEDHHELANQGIADWYKNNDELANYLADINPHWSEAQWKQLLDQYVKMTIDGTIALFSGAYQKDIEIFDRMTHHSLILGNYMADGVMKHLTAEAPKLSWHFLKAENEKPLIWSN